MKNTIETRQNNLKKVVRAQQQNKNIHHGDIIYKGGMHGYHGNGYHRLRLRLRALHLLDDGDVVSLQHDPAQFALRHLLGVQLDCVVQDQVHVLVETNDEALDAGIHLK